MSYNLPPGVTYADIDREMGGEISDEMDEHLVLIQDSKEACELIIKAAVDILIKKRFAVTKHELQCFLESIAEAIDDETEHAQKALYEADIYPLAEENYTPYPNNSDAFIAKEHDRLMEAFRPKAVNSVAVLKEILRPAVTNPATPGFGGELEPLAKAKE